MGTDPIRETMDSNVQHRTNTYLNHRLEQVHRGIRTTVLSDARLREPLKQRHASVVTRDARA